jgi:hypothetical protein
MAEDVVGQTIKHPIRKRLIEALWQSSEPLSARQFHDEHADGSDALAVISYHARVLERSGVAQLDREGGEEGRLERFLRLGGPNSAEAIRRLQLT